VLEKNQRANDKKKRINSRMSYGSIPDFNPTVVAIKEGSVAEEVPRRSLSRTLGVALISGLVAVSVFLYSANKSSSWSTTFTSIIKHEDSSDSSNAWTVYKMTTATTVGTWEAVESFANTYLCETEYTDLGCNLTNKVACNLAGSFGIHWVDSAIFNDVSSPSLSVSEWVTYIEGLGTSTFNPFMHNKVQLFVPDLTTIYSKLTTDSITFNKRLSMSVGSSTNDVAHLSIPMPNTGTIYEIIGPSSTLSTDTLTEFSEWESNSCPSSHTVPYSLDELISMFKEQESGSTSAGWEEATGLVNPMGVMISIPMSSLESPKLVDTMNLVTSMSGNAFTNTTTTTDGNSCTVYAVDINGMTVRYVQNSADFSSVEKFKWQVGDWEAAIMEAASLFVDSDNTEYSWNRYLDNHIGIYVPNASGDCEGYYDQIESTITENGDFDYGLRVTSSFGEGTHYYTATAGIRSWEFNAQYCVKDDETDICGCLADNSYVDYYSQYEKTCLKSQE
jgi:hypothetical protein